MKKNQTFKAAIFGGSFDPPHIGHINIVKECLDKCDIDRIFIVPTYLNPFKDRFHAPSKLRYEWLRRIFEKYEKVEVLDFEISKKRAVATIETVRYIYDKYSPKELYVIIGADNLQDLHKWREFEKLQQMVKFVVASRDNIKIPPNLINLKISDNISSTKLREDMDERFLPSLVKDEIIKFYKEKNEKQN